MAIFWKHIKGVADTGNEYSWISWTNNCPHIYINKTENNFDAATDLGQIITDQLDWSIYKSWDWRRVSVNDKNEETITNQIAIHNNYNNDGRFFISSTNAPIHVTKDLDIKLELTKADAGKEDVMQYFTVWALKGGSTEPFFKIGAKYSPEKIITNDSNFSLIQACVPTLFDKAVDCSETLHVKKYGVFDEYCRALYFSATSDKRAKENIEPCTLSALDFINKITVFSFNYKNYKDRTIGIMAQDVLNTDLKDLLVDNIDATGLHGDYMSIKEDKLIFVLLKAIQEQQKEIEDLKAKLK